MWIRRFNKGGLKALKDKLKSGSKPKISDEELISILEKSPRELGYPYDGWYITLLKVELERRGIKYAVSGVWKRVRKLRYKLKKPRPTHYKAEKGKWKLLKEYVCS